MIAVVARRCFGWSSLGALSERNCCAAAKGPRRVVTMTHY